MANFVGQPGMNFIQGKIESPNEVAIEIGNNKRLIKFSGEIDSKYIGSDATIGVRPQQAKVSHKKDDGSDIPATVKIVEFQGDSTVLTLKLDDPANSEIQVTTSVGSESYKRDEKCWLEFKPEFVHLFDKEEKAIIKR
ncbi:MAG: TOBE domain-containing protein [Candidatus Humimicrobiaceae bacterium]